MPCVGKLFVFELREELSQQGTVLVEQFRVKQSSCDRTLSRQPIVGEACGVGDFDMPIFIHWHNLA